MIINDIRELCYTVKVDNIKEIPGKDFVECAIIGGWNVMVKKGEFLPGDIGVYFEIDSLVPSTPAVEFMKKYQYKVKTQKFKCAGGHFYSQGLLMSLKELGFDSVDL